MGQYNVNPMQLIQMIKNGQNPQQMMINILEQNSANQPFMQNLLNLAKNGRTMDIEKIARNIAKERGIDFDQAFNSFKSQLGAFK
jgi:hypothetical protein